MTAAVIYASRRFVRASGDGVMADMMKYVGKRIAIREGTTNVRFVSPSAVSRKGRTVDENATRGALMGMSLPSRSMPRSKIVNGEAYEGSEIC